MELWTFLGSVLGAVLLYLIYQKFKDLYRVFREYYVLWNVALGARGDRRTISTRARLHAYVCKSNLLDALSVNQLFTFLKSMVDSDITESQFQNVVLSYKYVIFCRERMDGSLRGAMLLNIAHKEENGKKYTFFTLGLSFFEKFYQGGPLLYYVVAYHIFRELLFHPFTPVYIAGKAFSYKSYVIMANNIQSFYPRHDAQTPPFEQKLVDQFAYSVKTPEEVYDPKRCVLERTFSSMKEFVAPILCHDLENPHIKFFQDSNPGWQKGHQLITIGRVTWTDFLRMIFKAVTKARTVRHEGTVRKQPSNLCLQRQESFQSEMAKRVVKKLSQQSIIDENEPVAKEEKSSQESATPHKRARYSSQESYDVFG